MIYAHAHDQTVADDYFAAMQRVEQRLQVVSSELQEPARELIVEFEFGAVMTMMEQLAQPDLVFSERLEILKQLRQSFIGTANRPASVFT